MYLLWKLIAIVAESIIVLIVLAFVLVKYLAQGAVFRRAGEPFWYTFIPFLNSWTLHKISWGHGAYMFLDWIPYAGVVFRIITMVKLGTAFGRSDGFKVGLVFLPTVFQLVLGYGDSVYYGTRTYAYQY